MNAQAMEADVFGHVQAVRDRIGGPDIGALSRDLYTLAGHSRSALFAAKALAEGGAPGMGEHVLNLIELAHGALVGRFEEIEEGIDAFSGRLNAQIARLVQEQLALRRTVEALVGILDSTDLEKVGEAVSLLYDDWIRLNTPVHEHVFWNAFIGKLKERGVEVAFGNTPDSPEVARPVVFTEASAKADQARQRLVEKYVRDLTALDVANLDYTDEEAGADASAVRSTADGLRHQFDGAAPDRESAPAATKRRKTAQKPRDADAGAA